MKFLLLCLSATRSHSFQVTPQRTLPTSAAAARGMIANKPRNIASVLYNAEKEDEEGITAEEVALAGAKDATTALLMEEMSDETFEMDLGNAADNNETSVNAAIRDELIISEAPPLSFSKFLTMQGKRVIVTIRYSGEAGLKPYFLTAAKKIKASHPDVILERRQLADMDKEDPNAEPSFEILVDGKVVVGNNKSRSRKKIGNVDLSRSQSIFVSMQELDLGKLNVAHSVHQTKTVWSLYTDIVSFPHFFPNSLYYQQSRGLDGVDVRLLPCMGKCTNQPKHKTPPCVWRACAKAKCHRLP